MTREDIIRMAREAGAMFDHMTWVERDLAPVFERFAALVAEHARNRTWTQAHWTEYERSIAAAEREKLKHELLTLEKWRGMALAKDGDGRTVQEVQRESREAEREACAKLCDEIAIDMWKLYKGRPPYKGDEEGRASDFTQGRSAGADDCAEAIRRRTDAA